MKLGRRSDALLAGVFLGGLFSGATQLAALDPHRQLTQYRVEIWGVEEGLPSLSVSTVVQTPDGYLWVGTTEGLARFDGVRFKIFDRWNTPAFRLNEIRSLFVDSRGALWIGFAGSGVVVWAHDEFVAVGPSDLVAVKFAEDPEGVLLGTDRGLFRRRHENGALFEPVASTGKLAGRLIVGLQIDRLERTWLSASEAGVFWLEDGKLHGPLSFGNSPHAGDEVTTLVLDDEGNPVFSTAHGSFTYSGQEVIRIAEPDGDLQEQQYGQLVDRAGALWATSALRGQSRRVWGGVQETFPASHRVADGRFSPMFEDREGNLWFGSWTQGLLRLSDGPLVSYSKSEGMSSDAARTLLEDASGAIWVGTTSGLNRIAGGEVATFQRPQHFADARDLNWIYALAEEGDGGLALGTRAGLAALRGGEFDVQSLKDSRLSQPVFSLLKASDDRLWVGATAPGGPAGRPLVVRDAGRWVEMRNGRQHHLRSSRGFTWLCLGSGQVRPVRDPTRRREGPSPDASRAAPSALHERQRGLARRPLVRNARRRHPALPRRRVPPAAPRGRAVRRHRLGDRR